MAHVHKPRVQPTTADGFSLASNNFGLDLLQQFAQKNDQHENIFFSPYSVAVTLSTVYQGARGQSAEQLQKALRFSQVPKLNNGERTAVAQSVYDINQQLRQQDNQATQLDSANLMVIDDKVQLNDEYTQSVSKNYEAEVMHADFRSKSDEILKRINDFVSNKTNGLINPMLEQAPSTDTVMALINAVYFKGQWLKKFEPEQTQTGIFYGENGQQYPNVQFMKAQGQFPHTELPGLNADMVMIKYRGEDVVFVAVLPRDRDANLAQIRQQLNASYIDERIGQMISFQESTVYLPKMEVSTQYDLVNPLESLGVQDIFGDASDLSGITQQTKLKVSRAVHKAKLVVNEEGTEAGAGTYIEIAVMALPIEPPVFRFDHPFLYFIRHQGTGQILFLGETYKF